MALKNEREKPDLIGTQQLALTVLLSQGASGSSWHREGPQTWQLFLPLASRLSRWDARGPAHAPCPGPLLSYGRFLLIPPHCSVLGSPQNSHTCSYRSWRGSHTCSQGSQTASRLQSGGHCGSHTCKLAVTMGLTHLKLWHLPGHGLSIVELTDGRQGCDHMGCGTWV